MSTKIYPRTTVLAHGCFDLLHLGHIRHLQEARALGDRLVVSVTADPHVRKGLGRPHFTAQERAEALKALDCVDEVIISDSNTAVDIIDRIKPAIYVKGCDYKDAYDPNFRAETEAVQRNGGRIHITKAHKVSSSRLLNGERLDGEVVNYLETARNRGFLDKIKDAFERADTLYMSFVGESIADEYCYVHVLGRPSKEMILAAVEESVEQFRGGIDAAAAHCDWTNVNIVTAGTPLRKTRFVDADFNRKLFESYSARSIELDGSQRAKFRRDLGVAVASSDIVIVMDFGHGLMMDMERIGVGNAAFCAVNAQTNAGNMGFNPVTRYSRASLICVDEPEARLAAGDQYGSIDGVAEKLFGLANMPSLAITRGRYGSVVYTRDGEKSGAVVPAFTSHGVDTMGAGDAFLATAAPLLAAGLELEAAAFAGNVAGAIKTTIVGHRFHVTRQEVMQNVEALLA